MTYNEIIDALEATGYPVAEGAFSTDPKPEMPYITYQRTGDHTLYADGRVYWYVGAVEVHLYTSSKDTAAEDAVREALADIGYTWAESRIPAQACYDITITLEV